MSTLASDFLRHARTDYFSHKKDLKFLQEWTFEFIKARLQAPMYGPDIELRADQCAERYVFEEDAPAITRRLVESKAVEDALVWDSFRLPATSTWIEFPIENRSTSNITKLGLMIGHVAKSEFVSIAAYRPMLGVVAQTDKGAVDVVALLSFNDTPLRQGSYVNLHWFLDHLASDQANNGEDADAKLFVYDLVDAMFLINTPRVCETRQGSFGAKTPKALAKIGVPMVEYKRLVMQIGIGTPQYRGNRATSTGEIAESSRHKLHRVVGHFRTYRKGREQPKASFVPKHWRGDPALGIVLHERVIKK